jgi:hypothetical protein
MFSFGHVRQLDQVSKAMLTRAWSLGVGPGAEPMTVDVDSTIALHGTASKAPPSVTPRCLVTTHYEDDGIVTIRLS